MNHRQKLLLILGICIVAVAAVGGTSAYFVTSSKAKNVITTDGVGVELIESSVNDIGQVSNFKDIVGAMPGDKYSKIPQVKNTDNAEVWVRAKVNESAVIADGTEIAVDDLFEIDFNTVDWTLGGDGYYYYNDALGRGQTTAPLFTEVIIPKSMGNVYQKSKFNLGLTIYAVQAAHNGINVMSAVGWPEE